MSEVTRGIGRFADQVAIVTGVAHGIGAATVERLVDEGAAVAIFDIADGSELATRLAAAGNRVTATVIDVSDPNAVDAAVAAVAALWGAVDVLVNCAGMLRSGDALEVEWSTWHRTFAVNVDGILSTVKAVLPGMIERGDGAIVNVASVGGLFGVPGLSAYNSSKGAVVNLTRNLAADFRRHGVRINCVCPGWVPTGFNDPMLVGVADADLEARVRETVPAGRQAQPHEIAAAIAFLASGDASYVSGQALVVDGGMTTAL